MTERVRVALLFDDGVLATALREALREDGAVIVHQGPLAEFDAAALRASAADVLVINLDEEDEQALDRLDALVDGQHPRLIFNEAAASARLDGWDRARWARHLAAKLLASTDVDPPRPADAPTFEAVALPAPPAPPGPLGAARDITPGTAWQEQSSELADELEALLLAESSGRAVDTIAAAIAPDDAVENHRFEQITASDVDGSFSADPGYTKDGLPDGRSVDADESIEQREFVGDPLAGKPPRFDDGALFGGESLAREDTLAAELEALLASGSTDAAADDYGPGPAYDPALLADMPAENSMTATDSNDSRPTTPQRAGTPTAHNDTQLSGDVFTVDTDADEPIAPPQAPDWGFADAPVVAPAVPRPAAPSVDAPPAWGLDDAPFVEPPAAKAEATVATPAGPDWGFADAPLPAIEPSKPITATPSFSLDHLALAEPGAASLAPSATSAVLEAGPVVREAPASWGLLGDEEPAANTGPARFGFENADTAEPLRPLAEPVQASPLEFDSGLELLSIEEASAPASFGQARQIHEEMLLDRPDSALSRVVLLGAPSSGEASLLVFLRSLSLAPRAALVIVRHQGADASLDDLQAASPLPLRWAIAGERLRHGEIVVVPAGQVLQLRRDGRIELEAGTASAPSPSIDANFSQAAQAFGADTLGIVFAGRANDAVAGAQAIRDRGGQVWVELGEQASFPSDMVAAVQAEQLAGHAASPSALAARLLEAFA